MGLTVNVSGRVGGDPETRYSKSGMAITSFSVACEEYDRETKENKTVWCKCVLFGKAGERAAQVAKKGAVVELLAGKMKSREYEGKIYTDYIFNDFTVLAFPPKKRDNRSDVDDDDIF